MRDAFARFLDLIFPRRTDAVRVAAASDEPLRTQPVLISSTSPATHALLPFSDPLVASLVREAKYRNSERAILLLAETLARYASARSGPTVLIPMPMPAARLALRGYNHCERIAQVSGLSFDGELLVRTREVAPQARLTRNERMRNQDGSFGLMKTPDPSVTYVLLDDVITTGATMRAALGAFPKEAQVLPLALSYAAMHS